MCVCEISVRSRREGVKSGFRKRGLMITWAWLVRFIARDLGTLAERSETQLCDFITTEPARLVGIAVIPGGNFPSNHTCRTARWIAGQPTSEERSRYLNTFSETRISPKEDMEVNSLFLIVKANHQRELCITKRKKKWMKNLLCIKSNLPWFKPDSGPVAIYVFLRREKI